METETQVFIVKPAGCCDGGQNNSAGDEARVEAGVGARADAARVPAQRSRRVALAIGVPVAVGVLLVGVVVVALLKYHVLCPQQPQVSCVSTGNFSKPFSIKEKTSLKDKNGKANSVYEVFTAPKGCPGTGYLLTAELKIDSQKPKERGTHITVFSRREGSNIDEELLNKPICKLPTSEMFHKELYHFPEGSKVYLGLNLDDDVITESSIQVYRLCQEEH